MRIKKSTFIVILTVLLSVLLTTTIYQSLSIYQRSRYDIDNYCCRHMSRDIEKVFEGFGISTTIVCGYNFTEGSGHMWVNVFGIDIDSVTLYPFDPTLEYESINYYMSYEDWENGKNVR